MNDEERRIFTFFIPVLEMQEIIRILIQVRAFLVSLAALVVGPRWNQQARALGRSGQ